MQKPPFETGQVTPGASVNANKTLLISLLRFGRILRQGGIAVQTGDIAQTTRALELIGLSDRETVRSAIAAMILRDREDRPLFDTIFDLFWRAPVASGPKQSRSSGKSAQPSKMGTANARNAALLALLNAAASGAEEQSTTFTEANTATDGQSSAQEAEPAPEHQLGLFGRDEQLKQADFGNMDTEEMARSRVLLARLPHPVPPVRSRRLAQAKTGRIDLAMTLRRTLRAPDLLNLAYRKQSHVQAPLVLLIDISRSMEQYSQAFLAYAHGLTQRYTRVHTLVFGTRLTDISHAMRRRDPDLAIERANQMAQDWHGGTRIGASLAMFNRQHGRRLLSGNAALMLVTDGLERSELDELARETARLARHTRRLIWLNPLLRYDGFEPRAAGVQVLLEHVDDFLPMHNINSLTDIHRRLRFPQAKPAARPNP